MGAGIQKQKRKMKKGLFYIIIVQLCALSAMGQTPTTNTKTTITTHVVADTCINAIYYRLDKANKTAEVTNEKYEIRSTYRNNKLQSRVRTYPASYGGDVVIPTFIADNKGVKYTVNSIGENSFRNCDITSLLIPCGITKIGVDAFNSTKCQTVYAFALNCYGAQTFQGLNSSTCTIYAYNSVASIIGESFTGQIVSLGDLNVSVTSYYMGIDVTANCKNSDYALNKVIRVEADGKEIKPSDNEIYEIRRLHSNSGAKIDVYTQTTLTINGSERVVDNTISSEVKTKEMKGISWFDYYTTQTTITIENINAEKDRSTVIKEQGLFFKGEKHVSENNYSVTIRGLEPNCNYSDFMEAYVTYEDDETFTCSLAKSRGIWTESLRPTITVMELTPTTLKCVGSYTKGDATAIRTFFESTGTLSTEQHDGDTYILRNLCPGHIYNVSFTVALDSGGSQTENKKITTPSVTLTTVPAKPVKAGEVIVAATTNLPDDEVKVGFEWRKVAAPADLPSSKGAGAIYEGSLEARLKNLSAADFYRVRPYFEDAAGQLYYGDWMAFDPNDFSYCEPTVHTYADAKVSHESATLTGYVMAGTDEVLVQGFEYWVAYLNTARLQRHRAADSMQRVTASGQRMTAVLSNLQEGATYKYRAFVTTASGTIYGEEREFSVAGVATVDGIERTKANGQTAKGVYSLTGTKFADDASRLPALPRGIYIVDGRKVSVR